MASLVDIQQWRGTLADAAIEIARLLVDNLIDTVPPNANDLQEWQALGLLSAPPDAPLTGRQLLEAAYVASQKASLATPIEPVELAERLCQLSDHGLFAALTQADRPRVTRAVTLLAQGIMAQYAAARSGRPVGLSQTIPLVLRQAQAQLARFALLNGQPDAFASVSELLHRCHRPLAQWAPQVQVKIDGALRPAPFWSEAQLFRVRDSSAVTPTYYSFGWRVSKLKRGCSAYRAVAGSKGPIKEFLKAWASPTGLEITVARPGELLPDDVAKLVEALRSEFGHYGNWTSAPAPLHFAKVLKQYVPDYEWTEDEEEENK